MGRVRLDLALQQSIPCLVQTSCRPLPARPHSQHGQDRIAVDHCERPLLQFDNFSLVSVKNGTCIQSLRALSDSPLSYDVTHSLKHSDKFCDPVAFLHREEPGWRNLLVQQSFYGNRGHGQLVTLLMVSVLCFGCQGWSKGQISSH